MRGAGHPSNSRATHTNSVQPACCVRTTHRPTVANSRRITTLVGRLLLGSRGLSSACGGRLGCGRNDSRANVRPLVCGESTSGPWIEDRLHQAGLRVVMAEEQVTELVGDHLTKDDAR